MRKRLLARDNLVLRSLTARMGNYFLYLSSLLIRGRVTHAKRGAASGTLALQRQQLGKIALTFSLPLALFLLALFSGSAAMQQLDDHELSEVTGQALMQMAKTPGVGVSNGLTFYRAGLDAVLELNLNIDKLQLGCGGINGPGCDIDIDHLGLSGPENCPGGRPNCSASMTRPFFEFAIKNDDKPGLREVVGIRMSAERAIGLLTAGRNTPEPNGINSLSGYMVTTPISGTAYTQATNLGCGMSNASQCSGGIRDPFATVLSFDTNPDIAACTSGCYSGNTGTSNPGQSRGVYVPSLEVEFSAPGAMVNGVRQTATSVTALAPVPAVNLSGGQLHVSMEQSISVAWFITVSEATVNLGGTVSGLETQINFSQNLGFIHKIDVNSPFSLSFQSGATKWPGSAAADVAQPGWWMSFSDPVELGELNPVQQIDISPAFAQMAAAFNNHFAQGCTQPCAGPIGIGTSQGLEQLFNGEMSVNVGSQVISTNPLQMNVSDLQLGAGQNVVPNCWGSASFC